MRVITDHSSPNKTDATIAVEFVVLHYTGTTLRRTLEIFMDAERKASAHVVIDRDGTVYEVVPCLQGEAKRAWHAGESRIDFDGITFEALNDYSIGIELVNLNGNVFAYTDDQYQALSECLTQLVGHYPKLQDRRRVVGHEAIAGFRGKCDPGLRFAWDRIGGESRQGVCSPAFAARLGKVYEELAAGAFLEAELGAGQTVVGHGSSPIQVSETVYEALSTLCEQVHDKSASNNPGRPSTGKPGG